MIEYFKKKKKEILILFVCFVSEIIFIVSFFLFSGFVTSRVLCAEVVLVV